MRIRTLSVVCALVLGFSLGRPADAQLFDNLQAFGSRLSVGDPSVDSVWERGKEGPKGMASGDLDGDGRHDLAISNLDGTVTVLMNLGDDEWAPPKHLQTGTSTLRDILIADLNGDQAPDIATASILDDVVVMFMNEGGGSFGEPRRLATWRHARELAAGDFDGDGKVDLAVAGSSVGLRQFRGTGGGEFEAVATFEKFVAERHGSKPAYSLRVYRREGATRDSLVVSHAFSDEVCQMTAGDDGKLAVQSCVTGASKAYHLDVGPLVGAADSSRFDLVTVHRDLGTIDIRRGRADGTGFEDEVHQTIVVPGGPRSVKILDLDADGWNDLVVVLRNLDRVITLENEAGTFTINSESPVGVSPREVVSADFNRDGQPDLAVINRISSDVSVLTANPDSVGFSALDQIYLADGEVAGLTVRDFNEDGRDDVLQLQRASGDISVRLSLPDGSLAAPVFYTIGLLPADLQFKDVNNDGHGDIVTANLGRKGEEPGSISVRLGDGKGGFGDESRFVLPEETRGRLFALEAADFDGDGKFDVAAGFADCRISFYRGLGDGQFELARTSDHEFYRLFSYEVRSMAAGDFDQDGDMDLAGASMAGHLLIAENSGDLMTSPTLQLRSFLPVVEGDLFPTKSLISADLNDDGDLDLVLGSAQGAFVFFGAPGLDFTASSQALPGTGSVEASDLVTADFDGDGKPDIAVTCKILSCIFVLTQGEGGEYVHALTVDVPAGDFIASGDLDGDGMADLVGSGEVLWTALSSREAQASGPAANQNTREALRQLVINEILARNNALPIDLNEGRKSDWVELYNGTEQDLDLSGYRIVVSLPVEGGFAPDRSYQIPAGTSLESGKHHLLVASKQEGPRNMGFKLPGSGAQISLLDPGGEEIDRVFYPVQLENMSYARFGDAIDAFVFNPYPSPELSNTDNGTVEPVARLLEARPEGLERGAPLRSVQPFEPIRFYGEADDDIQVVGMSVMYRRLDIDQGEVRRVILFDDGLHEDGETQDTLFSGVLETGLPRGGSIEFYLEVMDLSGETITIPDGAVFADPSLPATNTYRLAAALPAARSLEISEFVARNVLGLKDEAGQSADWVEIRNCSDGSVSLDGVAIGDGFPMNEDWLNLPPDLVLGPGEHLVVFCDGNTGQGPLHAPFRMNGDGGRLVLSRRDESGAAVILDAVDYGAQDVDVAMARDTCGGEFVRTMPTPGESNVHVASARRGDVDRSGVLDSSDAIGILSYLFVDGKIDCRGPADVDSSGVVDISDPVYLLLHLFVGGVPEPRGTVPCQP